MKTLLQSALALNFLCLPSLVSAHPANAKDVLTVIDELCGDAWCESPYFFSFQNVAFDPQNDETEVSFWMNDETSPQFNEEAPLTGSKLITCAIPGYSAADEIIASEHFLVSEFREQLDACIQFAISSFH